MSKHAFVDVLDILNIPPFIIDILNILYTQFVLMYSNAKLLRPFLVWSSVLFYCVPSAASSGWLLCVMRTLGHARENLHFSSIRPKSRHCFPAVLNHSICPAGGNWIARDGRISESQVSVKTETQNTVLL